MSGITEKNEVASLHTILSDKQSLAHACCLDADEDAITAAWCRENKKAYFMLSTEVCK